MQNSVLVIKVKQRLNKLDSQDYDNIECWQVVEAFNKAQVEWVRRQLHGINPYKEGDEQTNRRKDDLQALLISTPLSVVDRDIFYQSNLPADYLFCGAPVHKSCLCEAHYKICYTARGKQNDTAKSSNTRNHPSREGLRTHTHRLRA